MICKNCGKENKDTNIKCEICNYELQNLEDILKPKKVKITLEQKICMLFFRIICIIMIAYGLFAISSSIYSIILENKIKKEYNQTNATLVEYTNCQFDEENIEICSAIYKYEVNDNTYTMLLDLDAVRDVYPDTEIVYYNPNNHRETAMYFGIERYVYRIFGIVSGIVIIPIAVFIILFTNSIYKLLKEPKKVL